MQEKQARDHATEKGMICFKQIALIIANKIHIPTRFCIKKLLRIAIFRLKIQNFIKKCIQYIRVKFCSLFWTPAAEWVRYIFYTFVTKIQKKKVVADYLV